MLSYGFADQVGDVDCSDALALATFWAAALGTDVDEDATSDRAYVEAPGWAARVPSSWPPPAGGAGSPAG